MTRKSTKKFRDSFKGGEPMTLKEWIAAINEVIFRRDNAVKTRFGEYMEERDRKKKDG